MKLARLRYLLLEDWHVPFVVLSLIASLALFSSVYFFVRIERETSERRDQICQVDERGQAQDVERLDNTYRYLTELPAAERNTTLTKAAVRGLPDAERDAREDDAPKFCDEPGVGRKEPDSKPEYKRPAWLEQQDRSKSGQSRYQRGP